MSRLPEIRPLSGPGGLCPPELLPRVQSRIDLLTKPPGSLGRLEALMAQVALVQGTERPRWASPQLVVFAADHGIAARGTSAWPREVTAQMVLNMLAGGAAVSVLAREHGLGLTVVDCGVLSDFEPAPGLVVAKTCRGSSDSVEGPALSVEQLDAAMEQGAALVRALPGNVLLLGEMGIGNTSPAALIMARLTGLPLERCVGRGAGLDDAGLAYKLIVLEQALQANPDAVEPLDVLRRLGGPEIATMSGAVLQAAAERRVIVVDGFITTAAVAVAVALQPAVLDYCVFSHTSAESGHARWLEKMGVTPLLDLGLRLGEGSGAALAWPLLRAALALLDGMASFASAGVSGREA